MRDQKKDILIYAQMQPNTYISKLIIQHSNQIFIPLVYIDENVSKPKITYVGDC